MKLKKRTFKTYSGKVYDLQVSNDPSYTINNVVVHNSSAGSLVAYLLDITGIDPIKYGLLFERFLNEGRLISRKKCEVIIITDDNNVELELLPSDQVHITRDGVEYTIQASEVQEGDSILKYPKES